MWSDGKNWRFSQGQDDFFESISDGFYLEHKKTDKLLNGPEKII